MCFVLYSTSTSDQSKLFEELWLTKPVYSSQVNQNCLQSLANTELSTKSGQYRTVYKVWPPIQNGLPSLANHRTVYQVWLITKLSTKPGQYRTVYQVWLITELATTSGQSIHLSNITRVPTPFYSLLVSISVLMALSTVFHSMNSPDNSPLYRWSVLPVLFLPHWSFPLCVSLWKSPSALM